LDIDINVKICFMSAGEINRDALREIHPSISLGCFIKKPVTIDYLIERVMNSYLPPPIIADPDVILPPPIKLFIDTPCIIIDLISIASLIGKHTLGIIPLCIIIAAISLIDWFPCILGPIIILDWFIFLSS